MDFGEALRALKSGKRVSREGWNGRGMWLELQLPDRHSKMTLPYIYMSTVDANLVPWQELAFPTVGRTLKCFFADRRAQHYPIRNEGMAPLRPRD